MITYKEALNIIEKTLTSLEIKDIAVHQAFGINSETVVSESLVPPFSNSAMDGFAIKSKETKEITKKNPQRLEIKNTIYAGDGVITSNENDVCELILARAPKATAKISLLILSSTKL